MVWLFLTLACKTNSIYADHKQVERLIYSAVWERDIIFSLSFTTYLCLKPYF